MVSSKEHDDSNVREKHAKEVLGSSSKGVAKNMAHKEKKKAPKGYWQKKSGQYEAQIGVQGRKVYLGSFDTPEEATRAYQAAKHEYHGPKAMTNFPPNVDVKKGSDNKKTALKRMAQKEKAKAKAYKGIWQRKAGKYVASIQVHGCKEWLGTFDTPEEASRAYEAAKHDYYEPKDMTNLPLNSDVNWTVTKKRSDLKKTTLERVLVEKPNDSVVEHVVDGVDLRTVSSDCCNLANSLSKETEERKNAEGGESNITDCNLFNNNGPFSLPTIVECDGRSRGLPQFENFEIIVNGSSVDRELPYEIRRKYYGLCFSHGSILHDRILMSINTKLAAEMISETVNISQSVRDCRLKGCEDNLKTWDKTLAGFEMLGMNVVFIRARINRLLGLCWESKEVVDEKRVGEIRVESCRIEGELKILESKIIELKNAKRRLVEESEVVKGVAEKYEGMFLDEANEPW